jgi:hypothetical protein
MALAQAELTYSPDGHISTYRNYHEPAGNGIPIFQGGHTEIIEELDRGTTQRARMKIAEVKARQATASGVDVWAIRSSMLVKRRRPVSQEAHGPLTGPIFVPRRRRLLLCQPRRARSARLIACTVASVFCVRWFSSSSKNRRWSFSCPMPGEVYERGEMLTRLIPNRADKDGGPEHAAVLAPKTNFKIAFSFAREGDLGFRQRLRIGRTRHQEVEALAEYLLAIVSG